MTTLAGMGPTYRVQERADWLTVYGLIERMNPRQRTFWLVQCCRLASVNSYPVTLSNCRGETDEVWMTYRSIAGQGILTVDRAGRVASRILGG